MQAELEALGKALEAPQRPVAAIVGGAKISTKLDLLGNLIAKVDVLIIGGGMANTFLAAQGKPVGKSLAEHDLAATARDILAKARRKAARSCCRSMPWWRRNSRPMRRRASCRVDCGRRRRHDPRHRTAQRRARRFGAGAGEDAGVERPVRRLRDGAVRQRDRRGRRGGGGTTTAGKLVSVAGGGDTVAALNAAGVTERFTYVSTAGGAFLEWLEGKVLPGVEALRVS